MAIVTNTITFVVAVDGTAAAATAGMANGATLVSASGQTVATIASLSPFGAISTNPAAATVTLMKMTLDVQSGNGVALGDFVSLIGNAVAFTGGVAALAIPGAQAIGEAAIFAGNLIGAGGVYLDSGNIANAFTSVYNSISNGVPPAANDPSASILQSYINAASLTSSCTQSSMLGVSSQSLDSATAALMGTVTGTVATASAAVLQAASTVDPTTAAYMTTSAQTMQTVSSLTTNAAASTPTTLSATTDPAASIAMPTPAASLSAQSMSYATIADLVNSSVSMNAGTAYAAASITDPSVGAIVSEQNQLIQKTVDLCIQAMASFGVTPAGTSSLPTDTTITPTTMLAMPH